MKYLWLLTRRPSTVLSTIGKLADEHDAHLCFTLEDPVRVDDPATPDVDEGKKVYGLTAIPVGTYRVTVDWSQKFKALRPRVLDVPGFTGIRIHAGVIPAHTLGCILVGKRVGDDRLYESTVTFDTVVFPAILDRLAPVVIATPDGDVMVGRGRAEDELWIEIK